MATFAVRVAFDGAFRGYPGLLLFTLAIAASAHLGGLRGGLTATALSCAASQYILVLPLQPLVFDAPSSRWMQIFLAVAGVVLSVLNEALQRSGRRAMEAARIREAAEVGARRDSALLADAQRLAGIGTWELDVAANRLSWSEETCRIFGVTGQGFGGTLEALYALVHPEDLERVKAIGARASIAGTVVEAQYRIVRPDGEVRTVSQRGEITFDGHGQPVRRAGVVMDVTERMAALDEQRTLAGYLAEERARLAAAQSVAKMGSWETDVDTRAVIWSDENHRIFETSPADFAPTHAAFLERVHPDDRLMVDQAFVLSLGARAPCSLEHRVVMADGRIKVVEERWQVSFGPDDRPVRVLGTCQDITERRQAQDALVREHGLLREAEGRYRSLFENSNEGIFQSTPAGRMVTANPAMARMLGFDSAEELISGRTDLEQQSYAQPAQRREFRRVLEATGSLEAFEYQVRRKDGTMIWVSENSRVVRDAQGRALLYEGSVRDITERRLAADEILRINQALAQQKTELQVVFDLMPAMVWFKDTQDGIVRVNRRVAESLGLATDEIEGRPSAEVYPRHGPRYREDDLEVIRSGLPKLGIVEPLLDAAGNEAWVQTDKVPYFDAAGKVVGIVVMAQDVSERVRAEARLRKTHNELIEVSRLGGMSEVATEVLHKVGNVLNSINVSASLAVEKVKTSRASRMADVVKLLREHRADLGAYITTDPAGQHIPELLENLSREWIAQQQLLATELEELRSNVDLVKRIVASQQGHSGAAEILESVALDQLVEEAVQVQEGVLTKQRVRLVRDFEIVEPVRLAKRKAVQILVSLLRNARQACKGREEADRCITLRIARVAGRAAISVSDNGSGIARENLVRIFAPGFSTRPDAKGYGLHSAALAAAELGGRLSVASEGIGLGATFTFELPLQPEAQAA
jgi:PAS domain S-box-containing protein